MATLYVENVPDDLYKALRKRARENRSSISAEVIKLLQQFVPTEEELARRAEALRFALRAQSRRPLRRGPFPSAEEMIREDRER
jgi:plasmid stability protein